MFGILIRIVAFFEILTAFKQDEDSQTPGYFINMYVTEYTEPMTLPEYNALQSVNFAYVNGKYREKSDSVLPDVGGCAYPIEVFINNNSQLITITYDKNIKDELFKLINTFRFND